MEQDGKPQPTGVVCPECNEGEVLKKEAQLGAGRDLVSYRCNGCGKAVDVDVMQKLLAEQ